MEGSSFWTTNWESWALSSKSFLTVHDWKKTPPKLKKLGTWFHVSLSEKNIYTKPSVFFRGFSFARFRLHSWTVGNGHESDFARFSTSKSCREASKSLHWTQASKKPGVVKIHKMPSWKNIPYPKAHGCKMDGKWLVKSPISKVADIFFWFIYVHLKRFVSMSLWTGCFHKMIAVKVQL